MLAITLADLRFRARQFLIAVVGAGVVFAIALLMTGMAQGFYNEIDRTVDAADADLWVVPTGTSMKSSCADVDGNAGTSRSAVSGPNVT